jgi:hypothetical protein
MSAKYVAYVDVFVCVPHGSDCLFSLIRRPHFVSFTRALGIASQQPGGPVSRPSFASSPRQKLHVSLHTISLNQASLACHAADHDEVALCLVAAVGAGVGVAAQGYRVRLPGPGGVGRLHWPAAHQCMPPAAMSHTVTCCDVPHCWLQLAVWLYCHGVWQDSESAGGVVAFKRASSAQGSCTSLTPYNTIPFAWSMTVFVLQASTTFIGFYLNVALIGGLVFAVLEVHRCLHAGVSATVLGQVLGRAANCCRCCRCCCSCCC